MRMLAPDGSAGRRQPANGTGDAGVEEVTSSGRNLKRNTSFPSNPAINSSAATQSYVGSSGKQVALQRKPSTNLAEEDTEGGLPMDRGGGASSKLADLHSHLRNDHRDVQYSQRWGVLASIWVLVCLRVLVATTPIMPSPQYELIFLYYQPLLLVVVMVWLWGVVLGVWVNMKIYPSPLMVFELADVRSHLTHTQIFHIAAILSLLFLTNLSIFTWACVNHMTSLASLMPMLAYSLPPVMLLCPLDVLHRRSRYFLVRTIVRCLFPFQSISFADFFLADIFTSLAKAISDTERALCSMLAGPVLDAQKVAGGVCGSASYHIPFWLAWPYMCRLLQCLRQFYDTRELTALGNAFKYSTAMPVIVLSAMKYHVPREEWLMYYKPAYLGFALLNSSFSFWWDVVYDWEFSLLSTRGCMGGRHIALRNELLYSPDANKAGKLFYYWILVSNFMLRITWTYKLSSHLRNHQMISTMVALLELFRRFQWIFLRVEKQYLSLTKTFKLSISYGDV